MSSLGQELRRARVEASFSLEEIAKQTKIIPRFLRALEEDRFDQLPEPFFVKGVLKAYVRAIGADEAYFLNLYQSGLAPSVPAEPPAPGRSTGARPPARPSPPPDVRIDRPELRDFRKSAAKDAAGRKRRIRLQPWVLAVLLTTLLAAVAALVYFYIQSRPRPAPSLPSARTEAPAIAKPAVPTPSPAGGDAPADKPADKPATPPVGAPGPSFESGLTLELRFTADTWIQVASDGRIVLDGIQAAGRETRLKAAEELVIQIGNAGGVDYALNGRPGVPFGPVGGVRTDIRINRQNAAEFLRNAPAPEP